MTTVGRVHLEPQTNECTCELDPRCGGVISTDWDCPEHHDPLLVYPIHSHPLQVRRVVGTNAAA